MRQLKTVNRKWLWYSYLIQDVPLLQKLRNHLSSAIGPKGDKLAAEGNYYYDARMCGIVMEMPKDGVFALRLGASIPLHYQWFHRFRPIGES